MRGEVGVLGGGKATALGKYGLELLDYCRLGRGRLELVGYKLGKPSGQEVFLGTPLALDSCRLGRGRRESEPYSVRSTVNSLKLSARQWPLGQHGGYATPRICVYITFLHF